MVASRGLVLLAQLTDSVGGDRMATRKKSKAAETLKKPPKWSAEDFGEGGYEIVPPEKHEEFCRLAEEENRRRRPGMYAGH